MLLVRMTIARDVMSRYLGILLSRDIRLSLSGKGARGGRVAGPLFIGSLAAPHRCRRGVFALGGEAADFVTAYHEVVDFVGAVGDA